MSCFKEDVQKRSEMTKYLEHAFFNDAAIDFYRYHRDKSMNDFDKDVSRFTDKGVSVLHYARQVNEGGSVYLDLGAGGLIIELEKLF